MLKLCSFHVGPLPYRLMESLKWAIRPFTQTQVEDATVGQPWDVSVTAAPTSEGLWFPILSRPPQDPVESLLKYPTTLRVIPCSL